MFLDTKEKRLAAIITLTMLAFIILIIIVMVWVWDTGQQAIKEMHEECQAKPECEQYRCYADHSTWRNEARNWLIKEQNCILQQQDG